MLRPAVFVNLKWNSGVRVCVCGGFNWSLLTLKWSELHHMKQQYSRLLNGEHFRAVKFGS